MIFPISNLELGHLFDNSDHVLHSRSNINPSHGPLAVTRLKDLVTILLFLLFFRPGLVLLPKQQ
jgi:hypothetical protein